MLILLEFHHFNIINVNYWQQCADIMSVCLVLSDSPNQFYTIINNYLRLTFLHKNTILFVRNKLEHSRLTLFIFSYYNIVQKN